MDITEVKVFPVHEEKLKAFVSVVFDHCFMVNDIKIIQGREGLFISMPSRKKKNGEFKDVAHPLNNETRRVIETKILGEYERVLAERGEQPGAQAAPMSSQPMETPQVPPPPMSAPAGAEVGMHAGAADDGGMETAAPPPEPEAAASAAPGRERTMEELEEMHLRDSFWTVT